MVNHDLIGIANQISAAIDSCGQKSFLCFGTLLSFIRDHKLSINGDIDIGIIGSPEPVIQAFLASFTPLHVVRDDVTREPYQMTFRSTSGICIDLFFWKKKGGFYYHTYDMGMVFSETGILKEYTFKGIPAICFDVPKQTIELYQNDIRYRGVTHWGTWLKELPQDPTSGITFPVPFNYGHCLDVWYPDWAVKRPQFGVSMAAKTFTVKTCRGIGWEE